MAGNVFVSEVRYADSPADLGGPEIEARWQHKVVDMDRMMVAFIDESVGEINSWKWDFGDGETSAEQHPVHFYKKGGDYVVALYVVGPAGKSRRSKVWDVAVK